MFSDLEEVLIYAPFRNDGQMLSSLLETHAIQASACLDVDALSAALKDDRLPGALIVTQEALTAQVIALVRTHLSAQPEWSELTVFVLVEKGALPSTMARYLAEHWPGSRQVFYQRPLATIELLSGVQSALLARLRQREVRDHMALERELRHELNHRVKNILASVTAIFRMTARNSSSVEELTQTFGGRLMTLGSVHSALFEAGGEAVDIRELVTLILSPYGGQEGARYELSGPPLDLNKDAATNLSLTLHELTTNAIKYGAWSIESGRISISWKVEGPTFTLSWRETGGPELSEPTRRGYGTRYIRSSFQTLLGNPPEIRFERQGLALDAHGPRNRIEWGSHPDQNGAEFVGS